MTDLFAKERLAWLDECRVEARKLLTTRRYITIEDVLKVCPRPKYIHRNTTGSVFRDTDFEMCGITPSTKPSSNGRWIMKWKLRREPMFLSLRHWRKSRQPEMVE